MTKARTSPLPKVAERLGVSRQTLKKWIVEAGFALPKRQGKGRHTILIYDWMEERLLETRVPRIPRISI